MHYVVYMDDPTKWARVHLAGCFRYVNRKKSRRPDNRWYDCQYSREEAFAKMKEVVNLKSGNWDHGGCMKCNP